MKTERIGHSDSRIRFLQAPGIHTFEWSSYVKIISIVFVILVISVCKFTQFCNIITHSEEIKIFDTEVPDGKS